MIPYSTQNRVFDALPDAFDLTYTDDSGTTQEGRFEITQKWKNEGTEPDQQVYHLLMANLDPTGVVRDPDELSLGPREIRDGTSTTVEEVYGTPVYDTLNLTTVIKGNHEITNTSPGERASQFIPPLERYLRYEFPNELADDSLVDSTDVRVEIPRQHIGSATDVSGYVGDEDVVRYSISLRLNYSLTYVDEIETVAGLDIDLKASQHAEPKRIEVRF